MAKHKYIETPEKLYELFEDYKQWVKTNPILIEDYVGKDAARVMREKPRCLSMAGFETFCYKVVGCVHQYFANQDDLYSEYMSICKTIKKEIRSNQIEGGMAGIFNSSITQRLNGLTDKQEVKTKDETPKEIKITIVKGNEKKKDSKD